MFDNTKKLRDYLYIVLKSEEEIWHPSVKKWDKIINEMDCDLAEKIYELV